MAIYHLHANVGTRAKGSSSERTYDYIHRKGNYSEKLEPGAQGEVVFSTSEAMPRWAEDRPRLYWCSADRYERKNATLFRTLEFSLPVEMGREQRARLALEFARHVTKVDGGRLPFSLAIHRGKEHNPHCHMMMSERVNDSIPRAPKLWFSRAAPKNTDPAKGGARKARLRAKGKKKSWLESVRQKWQDIHNFALLKWNIRASRIDCRTLEEQGIIDRYPTIHLGPGLQNILLDERPIPEVLRGQVEKFVRVAEANQSANPFADMPMEQTQDGAQKKDAQKARQEMDGR
jgi:hypothetical protein